MTQLNKPTARAAMSSLTDQRSDGTPTIPWVPFAPYSDEVFLKYHHINPVHGEVLVSMRFPPACDCRPTTTPGS